jgi:SAM-dependent methyltransferase
MSVLISDDILSDIACAECSSKLKWKEGDSLICMHCGRIYPRNKYDYFDFIDSYSDHSADDKDWDRHWDNVKDLDSYLTSNETIYFNELQPGVFRDKIMLVVGCGTGKNIEKYLMEKPRAVIMTDISRSLVQAVQNWHNVRDGYRDVDVLFIRCDINKMPFVRGSVPIIYVSCGLYNILDDQARCIREAMKFSEDIFLLFNSPENIFGRIYYSLNPVRALLQKIIPTNKGRLIISLIGSYVAYPFLSIFTSFASIEVKANFNRKALEFLIIDWIFMSPCSIAYNRSYYEAINAGEFICTVVEKTISRIVYYRRNKVLRSNNHSMFKNNIIYE